MNTPEPDPRPGVPVSGTAVPLDAGADLNPTVSPIESEPDMPRAPKRVLIIFVLTMFAGSLALLAPTLFGVAYKIQLLDPDNKEATLGIIVGIAAALNLVGGPLFGVLSDRTRTAWGRRRPWILGGIIVCAASGLLMATATTTLVVGIGWAVYTLAVGAALGAMNPVLAETIAPVQRGKIGALVGVGGQLAGVIGVLTGSLLTANVLLLFLAPVAVFGLFFAVYAFVVPDRLPVKEDRHEPWWTVFAQLVFNPLKHRDFALVWIGRFAMQVGLTFLSTYQLYYLLDRLGLAPEDAGQQLAFVGGIGVLVTTLFAVVGGILSDRLKRRKPFIYLAAALSAIGLTLLAFAPNVAVFAIAVSFVVAAAGLFGSVDLALASDVIPDANEAGRWMGIYYVANTTSTAIAPVFAPLILLIGGGDANYTALYLIGAVVVLGAAVAARGIRSVR